MELMSSFEGTIAAFLVQLTKSLLGLEDRSSYFEGHSEDVRGGKATACSEHISGLEWLSLLCRPLLDGYSF